jgi:hypothetical protein
MGSWLPTTNVRPGTATVVGARTTRPITSLPVDQRLPEGRNSHDLSRRIDAIIALPGEGRLASIRDRSEATKGRGVTRPAHLVGIPTGPTLEEGPIDASRPSPGRAIIASIGSSVTMLAS